MYIFKTIYACIYIATTNTLGMSRINPSEVSFSLGKPMTYEEMMADRARSSPPEGGDQKPQTVVPVDVDKIMANQPTTVAVEDFLVDKPKIVVGRDGTRYSLEDMQARKAARATKRS